MAKIPDNILTPTDTSTGVNVGLSANTVSFIREASKIGDSTIINDATVNENITKLLSYVREQSQAASKLHSLGEARQYLPEFESIKAALTELRQTMGLFGLVTKPGERFPTQESVQQRGDIKTFEDRIERIKRAQEQEEEKARKEQERQRKEFERENRLTYLGGYTTDDIENIRGKTRLARSIIRDTGESVPDSMRTELLDNFSQLRDESKRAREDYERLVVQGNMPEADRMLNVATSRSVLAKEIENVLSHHSEQSKGVLESGIQLLSRAASALAVGMIAQRVLFQDPFQFRFMPAMGTMARQGPVGEMLSKGFTEAEQYELMLNQSVFMGSLGAAALGAGGLLKGGKMALPGALLAAVGAGGAIGGATGIFSDVLQGMGIATSEEDILGVNLAQSLADPQKIIEPFIRSAPGLIQAAGSRLGPNLGFVFDQEAKAADSANPFLRQMGVDANIRRFGVTDAETGDLLTSVTQNLRADNTSEIARMMGSTVALGRSYGVGDELGVQLMGTLQRAGVQDSERGMMTLLGSLAGRDGELDNYAVAQLSAAIAQAVESLAIKNIARSGEQLVEQVAHLRTVIGQSDSAGAQILARNPQAFSRFVQGIDESVKGSLQDPSRLAWDLSLGSNISEILTGSPAVMQRRLEAFAQSPLFSGITDLSLETLNKNPQLASAIVSVGLHKIAPNMASQEFLTMLEMVIQGKSIAGGTSGGAAAIAADNIEGRAGTIAASDPMQLQVGVSEQIDSSLQATAALMSGMQELQAQLLTFVNDDRLMVLAEKGIATVVQTLRDILGPGGAAGSDHTTLAISAMQADSAAIAASRQLDPNVAASIGGHHYTKNLLNFNPQQMEAFTEVGSLFKTRLANPTAMAYSTNLPVDFLQNPDTQIEAKNFFASTLADPNWSLHDDPRVDAQLLYNKWVDNAQTSLSGQATGGFTGRGGRTDVVGVVHGGEYVISDNHASNPINREILERMQAGENVMQTKIGNPSISSDGTTTRLIMDFSGVSSRELQQAIYDGAKKYAQDTKLHFP